MTAIDDLLEDTQPCGDNSCRCYCGGRGHVCGCDCWRCLRCGQTEHHCQCGDTEAGR